MKKKIKTRYKKFLKRHERQLIIITSIAFLCAVSVLFVALRQPEPAGPQRLVTIYDHGKQQVVLTRADTVQGAMNAARISLDPHDAVEPSLTSKLTSSYVDVIIYRSRLVAITDGNIHQTVLTVAQSPNSVLRDAGMEQLGADDKAAFKTGSLAIEGTPIVLTIERVKKAQPVRPAPVTFQPRADALTVSKGAQVFVDSHGVAHRETYYDLPMNRVVGACGGSYTIRSDGAKVDQNGYVLVAANLNSYPRCSVVETSLGPGKVYDTGGFALRHPYGFDLATDWTNYNGV
jgi:hypothetical protein